MRNSFHYLVGFTCAYILFSVLGINTDNFPINWETPNNILTPLLGAIFVAFPAFIWEWYQDKVLKSNSDMNDVYRSSIGGLLGGILAMAFVSWYIIIPTAILSTYLVIFRSKK